MKKQIIITAAPLFILCFAIFCFAYDDDGIVSTTQKPGSKYYGCSCHCDRPDTSTIIQFVDLDSTKVEAKRRYKFKIAIGNSGYQLGEFGYSGINVAAFRGSFDYSDDCIPKEGETTHRFAELTARNPTEWEIEYIAPPTAGFDTLYVTGMAEMTADLDTVDTLDCNIKKWNFHRLVLEVLPSSGVEEIEQANGFALYPNPVTDKAAWIRPQIEGPSVIRIIDLLGRTVKAFPAELHSGSAYPLDLTNLPRGRYFVVLTTAKKVYTNPLIVS